MGLFDKAFTLKTSNTQNEGYKPLSDCEALVAIMYASISADGEVSDAEIDSLTRLLLFKNKFSNIDIIPFYKNALQAKQQFGAQHVIDRSAQLIREEEKPMVLALATELILSDGIITEEEKQMIEYISTRLNIDTALADKIIEVVLIKNKDNRIFAN